MIVGRKQEQQMLDNAYNDSYSHFVVVYGRRRIGKTFLIREKFEDKIIFQHTGIYQGTLQEQLKSFDYSLEEYGYSFKKKSECWIDAFEKLKKFIKENTIKRKVIFLDELSWMDTPKSDFLKALENFWNGFASLRKDIILVVCSSSTSWVINKVIHNKGGLYNRVTENIHLESFSLSECEDMLRTKGINLSRTQILELYMVFGGVPFYWNYIERGLSVPQNIDKLLFKKNSLLKDEFNYLYASIFKKPDEYIRIVEALSGKKIGMSREEIISSTGIINSGALTTKLEELEACGFIRKYYAFGMKKKNAIYQLIDNYTLFYYHFIKDGVRDEYFWENQINTPSINTWMGLSFEMVCLEHINQIKKVLGISGVLTEINSWHCLANAKEGIKGSQIDLLIVRKDNVINLCEMKYSSSDYVLNKEFDRNLKNKINDLQKVTKTKAAIFPTLVTTYGIANNEYSTTIQNVIVLDDLF